MTSGSGLAPLGSSGLAARRLPHKWVDVLIIRRRPPVVPCLNPRTAGVATPHRTEPVSKVSGRGSVDAAELAVVPRDDALDVEHHTDALACLDLHESPCLIGDGAFDN